MTLEEVRAWIKEAHYVTIDQEVAIWVQHTATEIILVGKESSSIILTEDSHEYEYGDSTDDNHNHPSVTITSKGEFRIHSYIQRLFFETNPNSIPYKDDPVCMNCRSKS
jgi:hypothetical protein